MCNINVGLIIQHILCSVKGDFKISRKINDAPKTVIIAEKIKYLRTSKGITQKQLAEALGVWSVSVQRFEYGDARPSLDTLIIIADYFEVSLDFIVGRTEKPEINR